MTTELLTERRGATLVMVISGPGTRNALSPAVYAAAVQALGSADADPAVRSCVLTGANGHFSAGGNLSQIEANRHAPEAQAQRIEALSRWIEALRTLRKPVVAAVEGAAAGAGCSIVLACDLVVASRDARFSLAYGRIGLPPDGGASHALARALPRQQALQWLWLAETRDAASLMAQGLVNQVVEPGQALFAALSLCDRLNAMSAGAIAAAKALINEAPANTLARQLDLERDAFVQALASPDVSEGLAAWRERRDPRFEGT